jgi:2-polyprenyl-6-methoxyphenol hydroxylase-like FAD-dependent oxidoreductase
MFLIQFQHSTLVYEQFGSKRRLQDKTFSSKAFTYTPVLPFKPSTKMENRYADTVKLWPLLSLNPLPAWVKGKMVLIGDAAHPMLPRKPKRAIAFKIRLDYIKVLTGG